MSRAGIVLLSLLFAFASPSIAQDPAPGPANAAGIVPAAMADDPPVSGGHSDADLEVAVEKALILESGVALTGVEVEVRNGVVTLSGTVNSPEARESAALAAASAGALRVNNELLVEPR